MNLNTPVSNLKGIGEKTAKLFSKLDIESYGDLLAHFPREYTLYSEPILISDAKPNTICTVKGAVASVKGPVKAGKYTIITVYLKAGMDVLEVTFFNQPYIKKMIQPGGFYLFRGKVIEKNSRKIMQSPKVYKKEEYDRLLQAPVPKYSVTKGLSSLTVSKAVAAALSDALFDEEVFPSLWLKKYDLCSHKDAIRKIHLPDNMNDVQIARRRLAFEEFFYFLMLLRKNRDLSVSSPNEYPCMPSAYTNRFIDALPFRLTSGQRKTWKDIEDELTGSYCMNRLVQGDVGSGKTLIAVLGLLLVVANGYQGALMAPTEVLARQHMETIQGYIKKYDLPFKPVLLVGAMKASEKKEAYAKIENGEANLIIGTHALIQDKVKYKDLALVVTDEQHRFGVRQREMLAEKGNQPHILVMSATPIPRTLAIILYGDLRLSAIHEMPAERLEIKTCVVGENYRPSAYKFISDQVKMGRQAYVICPMVEGDPESDVDEKTNVCDYTDTLRQALPGLRIDYLHGKMKSADKNRIMDCFANKDIDILVSTTVIEVGINVPNATVIMIENAEMFGLAQLHQLRGRVGRGSEQSYCILVSGNEDKKTMDRLKILNDNSNGFKIAEEDLKLRGPGELFGVRQSGEFSFNIADIYSDADLLELSSQLVDDLLKDDPKLLKEENKMIRKSVEEYIDNSDLFGSI